jgi:NTP pyrophosphatase (non-canonical NTP hydrolase)
VEFATMTERALRIRALYAEHERRTYGREWSTEELTLGLVGDVGDLAKLVQARAGVRAIAAADGRLGHELVDVLWAVVVIAERCGIDLEARFAATMDELETALRAQAAHEPPP